MAYCLQLEQCNANPALSAAGNMFNYCYLNAHMHLHSQTWACMHLHKQIKTNTCTHMYAHIYTQRYTQNAMQTVTSLKPKYHVLA